ncbi:MAG: hypothetical protein ACE3JP_14170 [Ectobacillus sp.]
MNNTIHSGLFIALYDEKTLELYLKKGIYGFLMKPNTYVSPQSRHFNALADYACAREGTHVFFFLKRKIYYGGQIVGNKDIGSFYINGSNSPLGVFNHASVSWDESQRYIAKDEEGIFGVVRDGKEELRCQPYLIRFEDRINQKGKNIISDDLYFELGTYPLPLPSNSMRGMGFCTLTPKEAEIALELIYNSTETIKFVSDEELTVNEEKLVLFNGDFPEGSTIDATKMVNEAQIEAYLLAKPNMLPQHIRPSEGDVLCRQVPISPFKPDNIDRADICIFKQDKVLGGLIPNVIIELKKNKANKDVIAQVTRYLRWLEKLLGRDSRDFGKIKVYVLAPGFTSRTKEHIPEEYEEKIQLMSYSGEEF